MPPDRRHGQRARARGRSAAGEGSPSRDARVGRAASHAQSSSSRSCSGPTSIVVGSRGHGTIGVDGPWLGQRRGRRSRPLPGPRGRTVDVAARHARRRRSDFSTTRRGADRDVADLCRRSGRRLVGRRHGPAVDIDACPERLTREHQPTRIRDRQSLDEHQQWADEARERLHERRSRTQSQSAAQAIRRRRSCAPPVNVTRT